MAETPKQETSALEPLSSVPSIEEHSLPTVEHLPEASASEASVVPVAPAMPAASAAPVEPAAPAETAAPAMPAAAAEPVEPAAPPAPAAPAAPAAPTAPAAPVASTQAHLETLPQIEQYQAPQKLGAPVITLRNVSKIYPAQPQKPALDGINIDIHAGELVFLVGHSGSGKSTFIRMLIRELKPTTGTVMVAGQDLTTMRDWKVPYLRRNIGCVFQDFKLLPKKTAYENVAFALECIGKSKHVIRTQVPEVLRLVGLEDKMHMLPEELSGGEQQRVSVARAFVNRPPLLICDEPTGNLDPAISLGIMKLLERINRTGTTVLVATHDREMVDSMRRRVIALENGHIIRDEENGGYGSYGAF